MSWQPEIEEIHRRRRLAARCGDEAAVARHYSAGKPTVCARAERPPVPATSSEAGRCAGKAYEMRQLPRRLMDRESAVGP